MDPAVFLASAARCAQNSALIGFSISAPPELEIILTARRVVNRGCEGGQRIGFGCCLASGPNSGIGAAVEARQLVKRTGHDLPVVRDLMRSPLPSVPGGYPSGANSTNWAA